MQRLASLLKVRPEEGQLVLLVGLLFLCIQAGQGMGDNAALGPVLPALWG